MATSWVVDASIATKLLLAESDSEAVRAQFDRRALDGHLMAPSLIRYEIGNAVARHGAPRNLDAMLRMALSLVERVEPKDAARFCGPLSYYDAAYLALAVESKANLWTADETLRKAAKKHGVPTQP